MLAVKMHSKTLSLFRHVIENRNANKKCPLKECSLPRTNKMQKTMGLGRPLRKSRPSPIFRIDEILHSTKSDLEQPEHQIVDREDRVKLETSEIPLSLRCRHETTLNSWRQSISPRQDPPNLQQPKLIKHIYIRLVKEAMVLQICLHSPSSIQSCTRNC